MQEWSVPGWVAVGGIAAVAVLACLLLVLLVRRERGRAEREAAAMRTQLDAIERRLDEQAAAREHIAREVEEHEFVITRLGEPEPAAPAASVQAERVPGPVFADLVLRESVVQAASLAAGVRRALSPEVRHRVRLEMRREVKRARKQRRTEQRVAVREWQARQRAGESAA